MPWKDKAKIVAYQKAYGLKQRAENPAKNKHGGSRSAKTFPISAARMRELWHIYHTFALQEDLHPLVGQSTERLKDVIFSIPHSDECNPRKETAEHEKDWKALR